MSIDNTEYREGFTKCYEGKPPWDIGRPQKPFVENADKIKGPILDVGCGTGSVALYFAGRGEQVTAIDLVDEAIRRAKEKASQQNLLVEFLVKDAFTIGDWGRKFKSVIDSGLFHVFTEDEQRKRLHVQNLSKILEPGGRLFLMCQKAQPQESQKSNCKNAVPVLPGISLEDLKSAFTDGWEFESLTEFVAEVEPEFAKDHPDAKWDTWFAVIRKTA